MTVQRKLGVAAIAVALVFIGVGCGGGDDAGDKLAEKIAEQNGGDVDIDSDSGKVSYTDEDGNKSEIDVSGSAELPKDWPSDLDPPDGVKIVTASTNTTNGQKTMSVLGEAEGSIDDWADGLKTQIEDAGFEIQNDSSSSGSGGGYVGLSATSDDYDLIASLSDGSEEGKVSISLTLSESST